MINCLSNLSLPDVLATIVIVLLDIFLIRMAIMSGLFKNPFRSAPKNKEVKPSIKEDPKTPEPIYPNIDKKGPFSVSFINPKDGREYSYYSDEYYKLREKFHPVLKNWPNMSFDEFQIFVKYLPK